MAKSQEKQKEPVFKVTLSSNRVVLLRPMKIKYNKLAMQMVGNKAGENKFAFGTMVQEEVFKMLLVAIDDQKLDQAKIGDLDDLFEFTEYQELLQVLEKITGGAPKGEPQVESVFD